MKKKILEIIERERVILGTKSSDHMVSKFTMLDVLEEIENILSEVKNG
jgi:hypothetical protein